LTARMRCAEQQDCIKQYSETSAPMPSGCKRHACKQHAEDQHTYDQVVSSSSSCTSPVKTQVCYSSCTRALQDSNHTGGYVTWLPTSPCRLAQPLVILPQYSCITATP
jgi:hypothetical protein